jgi:mRNA-degrading endonuclease RelE of RelBE toxin-antitoxin system
LKIEIKPGLEKKLLKIARRDPATYEAIMKKIDEIANTDITHYKNLRYELHDCKRVHIGHFVLIFYIQDDILNFLDYDHHDRIYE